MFVSPSEEHIIDHPHRARDKLYQDPFGTYNPVPMSNLTRTLGRSIDFGAYISAFTPRSFPERVIVTSSAYATALADILDETHIKVVEGYLVARAALAFAPHLGDETKAWKAQRALFEKLNGIKPGATGDRSQYCVGRIEVSGGLRSCDSLRWLIYGGQNTMGFAAGRYFSNVTFGGDSKEKGTKVITGMLTS